MGVVLFFAAVVYGFAVINLRMGYGKLL